MTNSRESKDSVKIRPLMEAICFIKVKSKKQMQKSGQRPLTPVVPVPHNVYSKMYLFPTIVERLLAIQDIPQYL